MSIKNTVNLIGDNIQQLAETVEQEIDSIEFEVEL